jgi:hypothetical protein
VDNAASTYHGVMDGPPLPEPEEPLDPQDRIGILQLLALGRTERLQYLLDELDFDKAVERKPRHD